MVPILGNMILRVGFLFLFFFNFKNWVVVLLNPYNNGCVTHYGLAIYIKKYLKAKKRIMEMQLFHHAKI